MSSQQDRPAVVEARTKFFDPIKGFGFVTLPDGKDAFLHRTTLEKSGFASLNEGQTVSCEITSGERSLIVTRIISVESAPEGTGRRPRLTLPQTSSFLPNFLAPPPTIAATPKKEPGKLLLTRAGRFHTGVIERIDQAERNFCFVNTEAEGQCFMPPPVFLSLPPESRKPNTRLEIVTLMGDRGPIVVAARPLPQSRDRT